MTTEQLIKQVEAAAQTLIANPMMKPQVKFIRRKVTALKLNPSAKAAHIVISDLLLMAERVRKAA